MTFLFTPDIFRYDEEFTLEGETLAETVKKLEEECPINCLFAVYRLIDARALEYIGLLKLEENKEPEWLSDNSVQICNID